MSSSKSVFFTKTGMLRIRWWPLIPVLGYLGYNACVLMMVLAGAPGHADPVLNAPIYWLFGR